MGWAHKERGTRDYGAPSADGVARRFKSYKPDPENSVGLNPEHEALVEARTIFPASVVHPAVAKRVLVSGANNAKLGGVVLKGDFKGFPIFHLTLEERATCPRSCGVWASCYGNTMHMARRHMHGRSLEYRLAKELAELNARHPGGFLVRLHALGDFYSVEYVKLWAEWLGEFDALHCFGYTANLPDAADPGEARIGRAIEYLTREAFDSFAIRFSAPTARPQGSLVVEVDPQTNDVIVCPGQTEKTAACASCGLCWSPTAKHKTVAFLRHGMRGGRRAAGEAPPLTGEDADLPPQGEKDDLRALHVEPEPLTPPKPKPALQLVAPATPLPAPAPPPLAPSPPREGRVWADEPPPIVPIYTADELAELESWARAPWPITVIEGDKR